MYVIRKMAHKETCDSLKVDLRIIQETTHNG